MKIFYFATVAFGGLVPQVLAFGFGPRYGGPMGGSCDASEEARCEHCFNGCLSRADDPGVELKYGTKAECECLECPDWSGAPTACETFELEGPAVTYIGNRLTVEPDEDGKCECIANVFLEPLTESEVKSHNEMYPYEEHPYVYYFTTKEECESCAPTPGPAPTDPSDPSPGPPGMMDDPHLRSWDGQFFDYHGECDLKLVQVPLFDGTNDLDIHVRTRIRYDYSYIESSAIRIGDDVFEVSSFAEHSFNGVVGAMEGGDRLPTIGGRYPIVYSQTNPKKQVYTVLLDQNQNITFSTFKDWVSVQFVNCNSGTFGKVSGMLGTYDGKMLARDGTSLHDNINALGQDWQIQPHEDLLFRTVRAPQAPEKCILPDPSIKTTRRLGETMAKSAAEKACAAANLKGRSFDNCVHDVMVSGDMELAALGDF